MIVSHVCRYTRPWDRNSLSARIRCTSASSTRPSGIGPNSAVPTERSRGVKRAHCEQTDMVGIILKLKWFATDSAVTNSITLKRRMYQNLKKPSLYSYTSRLASNNTEIFSLSEYDLLREDCPGSRGFCSYLGSNKLICSSLLICFGWNWNP